MDFWNIIFYVVIVVGALLIGGLTYYRIDWARHPEKYQKDLEELEKEEAKKAKEAQEKADAKKAQSDLKRYQKRK